MPTTEVVGRLTPFHVIRTSEVSVSMGETYEIVEWVDGKKLVKYGLSKAALNRIAQAAGIEFDVNRTGMVGVPTREYMQFRAVARLRIADGTLIERPGSVEWFYDLEVAPLLAEVAELQMQLDAAKTDQDRRSLSGKLFGKKKQAHDAMAKRLPMCETKAMLRAIRAILPIKSKYDAAELAYPFVVPRVDVVPDVEDPHVRELMKSRAIDVGAALYGEVEPQRALAAGPSAPMQDFEQEYPETSYEEEFAEAEPEGAVEPDADATVEPDADASVEPMTDGQRGIVMNLARELGLKRSDLHQRMLNATGVESSEDLTAMDADALIQALQTELSTPVEGW